MKTIILLTTLLLTPTLLFARLTKDEVVGNWTLMSKHHYLTMTLNRKGFVKITTGNKKHKPRTLPLGIWSAVDDELKITIYGKIKFLYKHVRFKGKTITVRNRHGKIQRFKYTPPAY
jgi:hypothetical protein